jgi:single-strand DNA-binding protein
MANTITVTGNLTRDPELRFTQGGRAVANFRIASSRRFQMNNEWQEQTSFFDVVAWAELGENAAASLSKGARVIVTGRIEQRDFETREGEKRTVFEITADEIGPSLRWATAQVERTDRSGGGGGGGGGGDRSYGGSGGGRPAENQSYGGGDEEPF